MNYPGPERRTSNPKERAEYVDHLRTLADAVGTKGNGGASKNTWWLMGILAALCIGGISGLGSRTFDRIFPPNDPAIGYFSTAWKEKVDGHIVVSEYVIAELRKGQAETTASLAAIQSTLSQIQRDQAKPR